MAGGRAAGAGKKKELAAKEREALLKTLRERFEKNMGRHKGIAWGDVAAKLEKRPEKVWSLSQMEATGGEPDVVGVDEQWEEFLFFDCAAESPAGRWSFCYDREALEKRKEHKPKNSAVDAAAEMGVELLSEEEYFRLQKLGEFDTKTQSWIKARAEVRELGGGLFGDRRFGRVFVYHNGADAYFAGRGFRGVLRV